MGFLDKIVGAVTGGASARAAAASGLTREQAQWLTQAVESFEKAGKELPARAAAFLVDGTQETVLLDLQAARSFEPGQLLGNPGRLRWSFNNYQNKPLQKIGESSLAVRERFYASIDAKAPPLDVLVRLGKLLAAADGGTSLEHPGAPVPDWLQYLVNDAVFASFNKNGSNDRDLAKHRPAWSIHLIAALLAHEGLDAHLALQEAFERKGLDSWYQDRLEGIVDATAVADYMRSHREATEALPAQLSASGRVLLAKRLGKDKTLLNDFAPLFVRLAIDGSKTVRAEATPHLEGIAQAQRLELLGQLLKDGDTTQRTQAAELLARLPGDAARALLAAAAETETSKAVQQAIRSALSRLDAAGDAGELELPEPPAWQPFEDQPLGDDVVQLLIANRVELLEKNRLTAEAEIADNKSGKHKYNWSQKNYEAHRKISDDDMRAAVRVLNGLGSKHDKDHLKNGQLQQVVSYGNRLQAHPSFGMPHLIRWLAQARHWSSFWFDDGFHKWLGRQPTGSVDLRALAELLQRSGMPIHDVAHAALFQYWNQSSAVDVLPADRVWPFFAEHPEYIDEGLGLIAPPKREGRQTQLDLNATLRTLAIFPTVQARWLPRVMELALGEGKTHRSAAQKALSMLPDIGRRVVESLDATKSEVRIEAANWLAELKYTDAVPAITKGLEKETRETVRAAYLTALEALGDDISPRLAPAILLAEAKKGLKAKPPAGLAWFSLDALPACKWLDGSAVEPEIVRWWVVLACKLKEPGGNALLTRYLGLLEAPGRQAIGSLVLRQFIAQDTRHPSLDEGIAHANAVAPPRYQGNQTRYQNAKAEHKQYYEADFQKTQEQVFEECKREKMGEYLGSAIGEKGILALTAQAPGHEVVTLLQQYMRDHYQRRSQIEAMLEGVAPGNDPVVIQLLLGVSRRYRTASVQEKARTLVQQIADRNGWTQDQLADRTIPTAGLDDTGTLELPYGDRTFTVVLDAAMKPELRNPEGKVVKALPEPRQNDDPALIKEAKSQFSTSKKELKQVIDLQTARLFEAMCTGRIWPEAEWREYLHRHPIAGRLIQRLVWLVLDAEGKVGGSFRPTEDGSLIDTQDDEVELAAGSQLRLGHASLVDDATAAAWNRHFKDYKLAPLFPQMTRKPPAIAFTDDKGHAVSEIKDRQGWISDTFTLRGSFTKLGYQRAQAEDGGFFYQYTKEFSTAGVRVAIDFSGNTLPEENVPAALKTLSFEDMKTRGYSDRALPLAKVPPVLLAEAYADYLAIAQACAGFDAGWEKKMPW
jgi:HEAT repeat protein